MTNDQLAQLIRDTADKISTGNLATIDADVAPLRQVTSADSYVGMDYLMTSTDSGYKIQLEWFAGQLLSIVDNRFWAGVNSWLNVVDKFTARKEVP